MTIIVRARSHDEVVFSAWRDLLIKSQMVIQESRCLA
ncbi:hypothetical protein PEC301645_24230 [Pectobacterium carotovorum subsp. carotovorum]|nr:hypothetical protein PEC301645_24230 [Pectobacterium carotovorum subsp. carotovorum]